MIVAARLNMCAFGTRALNLYICTAYAVRVGCELSLGHVSQSGAALRFAADGISVAATAAPNGVESVLRHLGAVQPRRTGRELTKDEKLDSQ